MNPHSHITHSDTTSRPCFNISWLRSFHGLIYSELRVEIATFSCLSQTIQETWLPQRQRGSASVRRPFKIIQGHWFWYHRTNICDFLSVINPIPNIQPISHRLQVIADHLRFRHGNISLYRGIIPKEKRSYPGSQKTPWRMTRFWSFCMTPTYVMLNPQCASPEIQEWSHKSRSRINNLYLLTRPIASPM